MDTQLQGQTQPKTSEMPDASAMLWSNSPAWRALVISSCLLTSLAISAPLVLPVLNDASVKASCKLSFVNAVPTHVRAIVTGFVAADEVPEIRSRVEATVGGKENPEYLSERRALTIGLHSSFTTSAVIPDGMVLKVGDVVELNSRYRDRTRPCSYIPWTINRTLKTNADATNAYGSHR
jgi:hypothetical protein